MSTFKELCEQRFSVRGYTAEKVAKEDMDYVLECARLAPSAVNFQPWRFFVVESDEMRGRLQKCYHREWFDAAPAYIVCVCQHGKAWTRQSDNKRHGDIDIAIATEHICLAAAERGLGTCWVCNFDAKLAHEVLGLAADEEAAVIVPIGHPSADAPFKAKQRKEIGEIVVRV